MVAPFRLLCTNAFGLSSKLGDFQHALLQHNTDVAVVTETKFTTENVQVSDTIFPGYSLPFWLDRTAHRGGIAIWVRSTLPALIIDELPPPLPPPPPPPLPSMKSCENPSSSAPRLSGSCLPAGFLRAW